MDSAIGGHVRAFVGTQIELPEPLQLAVIQEIDCVLLLLTLRSLWLDRFESLDSI